MIPLPKEIIKGILVYFIDPYVIRDSAGSQEWSVKRIWLYLNSRLGKCFENLPKEISTSTIESIAERLSAISVVELIALAFVASRSAKNKRIDFEAKERIYSFKCALLNMAILRFYLAGQLYYVQNDTPWLKKRERPFLLVSPDRSNQHNLSFQFSIEGSYHISNQSFILEPDKNPTSFIKLHLPKIQLYPEIAEMMGKYELGKITPVRFGLPSNLIVAG
ncbi:MAG: hypothetical protein AAB394_01595 [Patescibacteria group bacterium]